MWWVNQRYITEVYANRQAFWKQLWCFFHSVKKSSNTNVCCLLQKSNLRNLAEHFRHIFLMSPHLTCLVWWYFPLISLLQHFTTLCNGDWGYLRQGRLGKGGRRKNIPEVTVIWWNQGLMFPFSCICSHDLAASSMVYEPISVDFAWIKLFFSVTYFFLHSQTNVFSLGDSS